MAALGLLEGIDFDPVQESTKDPVAEEELQRLTEINAYYQTLMDSQVIEIERLKQETFTLEAESKLFDDGDLIVVNSANNIRPSPPNRVQSLIDIDKGLYEESLQELMLLEKPIVDSRYPEELVPSSKRIKQVIEVDKYRESVRIALDKIQICLQLPDLAYEDFLLDQHHIDRMAQKYEVDKLSAIASKESQRLALLLIGLKYEHYRSKLLEELCCLIEQHNLELTSINSLMRTYDPVPPEPHLASNKPEASLCDIPATSLGAWLTSLKATEQAAEVLSNYFMEIIDGHFEINPIPSIVRGIETNLRSESMNISKKLQNITDVVSTTRLGLQGRNQ